MPSGTSFLQERLATIWERSAAAHSKINDTLAGEVTRGEPVRHLNDQGLVQVIAAVLACTTLPASALTVKITETALMNDLAQVSAVVHELRVLGVGASPAGFGTDGSSLAHLHRLPPADSNDLPSLAAARAGVGMPGWLPHPACDRAGRRPGRGMQVP